MQEFESEIDHSITFYRKSNVLTGDRIRDKTFHSFGGKGNMFAAKRDESLFDFWLFNEKFFAIEAKQTAEKSLPYKNIKQHQIENLTQVDTMGGVGIFLVNFRSRAKRGKDGKKQRLTKDEKWDCTYALDIKDFLRYQKSYNRSSIDMDFFEEYGFKIFEVRTGFTTPRSDDGVKKPIKGWDLISMVEHWKNING